MRKREDLNVKKSCPLRGQNAGWQKTPDQDAKKIDVFAVRLIVQENGVVSGAFFSVVSRLQQNR